MLDAFAHGHDRRVARHHVIIDDDAAFDHDARRLGEPGGRADADRHDHDVGGEFATVLQLDAADLAVAAGDFGGVATGDDGLAAPFQLGLEQEACRFVELALHQRGHQVDDGDLHAPQGQAVSRFKAEQTAADNHRRAAVFRRCEHLVDIVEIAEGDDAVEVVAGDGDDERVGPRGDQQAVVGLDMARPRGDGAGVAIDGSDRIARDQRDFVVRVPFGTVDHDVLEGLFACQHGREHDAVVVHARLGAEDRHVEAGGIAGEDFLYRAAPGHAVADHHQALTDLRGFRSVLFGHCRRGVHFKVSLCETRGTRKSRPNASLLGRSGRRRCHAMLKLDEAALDCPSLGGACAFERKANRFGAVSASRFCTAAKWVPNFVGTAPALALFDSRTAHPDAPSPVLAQKA